MVETAVLFETFDRVDYARVVFEHIKKVQPKKLYFYSNKGRLDRPEELRRNNEIRSLTQEIDWKCDLHTFFRDEYVDVYTSLKGAIDWLFDNEEQGIILEDDCVANAPFFQFCDYYLDKYKQCQNIAFITGDNYYENFKPNNFDHIVTNTFFMFGWATWRDRWKECDFNLDAGIEINNGILDGYYENKKILKFWKKYYTPKLVSFLNRTHCWDYIFALNCIKKHQYGIAPIDNLVRNIGVFGAHSSSEIGTNAYHRILDVDFYPFNGSKPNIAHNSIYDDYVFKYMFGDSFGFQYKVKVIIKKIMSERILQQLKKIINNVQS